MVGKHHYPLDLQFSPSATVRLVATTECGELIMSAQAKSLHSSLHELEGLLEKYSPLMDGSTERALDTVLNYGVVFAEVSSPRWTPVTH